jgi:DNA repair exonuclease SbcCD ATPase subunit
MDNEKEGKAENSFKNFGAKVDQFMGELDEASQKLGKEFQDKYEELKAASERIRQEAKSKERWKEVEDSLQKAGEELKKAFESAFRKPENKK